MLTIKKRCIRCRQYLREDGTCQNPKCVRYTPEVTEEETKTSETTATTESSESKSED